MSEPEARRVMSAEGDEVVRPWEERTEVVEAGLDDTTAPAPEGSGTDDGPTRD